MDVLESLTDTQITDFLSGRSPLTISLRVGAHMMYVQLQLSAQDIKELGNVRDSWSLKSPPGSGSTHKTSDPAPISVTRSPFSSQRPRTSTSSVPTAGLATSSPSPSSPLPSQAPRSVSSTPSLPPSCPTVSVPRQAAAPLCCPGSSSPGPLSPAVASTFTEGRLNAPPTAELPPPPPLPGAVIQSFVSHSPGVFSGTFSGTLAHCSQSNISHPRHGVSIILQILNDLLRAACSHQGAPPALTPHLHSAPTPTDRNPRLTVPPGPPAETEQLGQSAGGDIPSEENRMLHRKLERLQRLMLQRRLRRRTGGKVSQTSRPYWLRPHQPHQPHHPHHS